MSYFDSYCVIVQYITLIYFYCIIPFLWFFPKGKLISTHDFLSTFWFE